MNQKNFGNALARAQKMILDEGFNARVESVAKSYRNGGGIPMNVPSSVPSSTVGNNDGITLLEDVMGASGMNEMPTNTKLPKEILESFSKTPPMSGEGTDNTTLGILSKGLEKNVIKETVSRPVQQEQYQPTQGGSIDYSLIKAIIDESVRRNLEEMKGSMLNESASSPKGPELRGMTIKDGNKIQFLDAKGNLYEGILKLKKRAQ